MKTELKNQSVMKNKDLLNDELDEAAPFLKDFRGKADGFRVPEGYFESLEDSVYRQIEAIGATRRPPVRKSSPSLWQVLQSLWQPRTALVLAGIVVLVLAARVFVFSPQTDVADAVALVSAEDAEAYLLNNLMEMEPEQLAAVLPADTDQEPTFLLEHSGEPTTEDPIRLSPKDLDHILRDLSDDELDQLIL